MAKSKAEAYHVAQLEKAAEIIRTDLDRLTPAEFVKLREDLHEFCYGAGFGPARQGMLQHIPLENFRLDEFFDEVKRQRKMIPDNVVREIVESLRKALTGIATTAGGFSIPAEVTKGVFNLSAPDKSSLFTMTWNFTAEEVAIPALGTHLSGSGLTADRILIWRLESCGKLLDIKSYGREDREHYCSTKCARNAATIRYREKKARKQKTKKRRGKK